MPELIHRLAITAGEPAGIGPDLCVQMAQQDHLYEMVVIADARLLAARAQQLNLPLEIIPFQENATNVKRPHRAGVLSVLDISVGDTVVPGELNVKNAPYVLSSIDAAITGCKQGVFDALVTGPVHKGIINEAGIPFTGHTEYIAQQTGGHPVMMLATEGLRVALATTHLPLKEVSAAITRKSLSQVVEIVLEDLTIKLGINSPRVLVCGLNPHAGEDGHLGLEEIEVITPVLQHFRDRGMNVQGPLSADTLFTADKLKQADAVLAMYHDQGLPVLKHMGFGEAVNITLGLPMIRTSVDHGTALELAGTGKAKADSFLVAMSVADEMVRNVKILQNRSVA
jgi:4-hydroxythreonine-4-phosphate dehydrogenase